MPTRASRNEKNKKLKKATKKLQRKDATRKVSAGIKGGFKLTYATMFDPPEEMHSRLEKALADVKFSLIDSLEEGLSHANDVDYGLTAGFYGSKKEVRLFFNNIHAGVTYANRPQGATTGAWPGFQPFGGWKGSGTGEGGGSLYYIPQYLRKQSQTLVE